MSTDRTSLGVVVALGIVAVVGAGLAAAGYVSRISVILSVIIWIAYTTYWAYERRQVEEPAEP